MFQYQPNAITHVPKRTLAQWQSEPAPDHNGPQYKNTHFKPSYPPQSSVTPWVPNNSKQYERPPSPLHTANLDFSPNHSSEPTQQKQLGNKSPWSKVLKIGLALVMISAALGALGLGIYAVINTNMHATTSNSTTTTTTTTTSTTSIILPPQCSAYTFLNDPTRLATAAGGSATDSAVFGGSYVWYRFYGSGGTDIVTTPPAYNRCGGTYAGWYAGVLPAYGYVRSGPICYVYTNICYYTSTILVTNCGSYNVYGLVNTLYLYARYCTV